MRRWRRRAGSARQAFCTARLNRLMRRAEAHAHDQAAARQRSRRGVRRRRADEDAHMPNDHQHRAAQHAAACSGRCLRDQPAGRPCGDDQAQHQGQHRQAAGGGRRRPGPSCMKSGRKATDAQEAHRDDEGRAGCRRTRACCRTSPDDRIGFLTPGLDHEERPSSDPPAGQQQADEGRRTTTHGRGRPRLRASSSGTKVVIEQGRRPGSRSGPGCGGSAWASSPAIMNRRQAG